MLVRAKVVINIGRHFSALLPDPSKSLDCLPHDIVNARLDAYGFKNDDLCLIFNDLNNNFKKIKNDVVVEIVSKYFSWSSTRFFDGSLFP